MGPTGAGKTALAFALADKLPVELVSVDSVMIYRGMNIGSAKPTVAELKLHPHHLVDILDPPEPYSAAKFVSDVQGVIEGILKRGRMPLLVGGTMLYFRALQQGLSRLPESEPLVRAEIEAEAAQKGWLAMHALLEKYDSEAARRIHPNDPQRLSRALEVYRLTGVSMTELQQQHSLSSPYHYLNIALFPARRAWLHERIETRFSSMLTGGLIEEVERLLIQWPQARLAPSLRSVGYRQVIEYLDGTYDKAMLLAKGTIATRQLAKRQCTWLRSWPDAKWFDPEDKTMLERVQLCIEELKS